MSLKHRLNYVELKAFNADGFIKRILINLPIKYSIKKDSVLNDCKVLKSSSYLPSKPGISEDIKRHFLEMDMHFGSIAFRMKVSQNNDISLSFFLYSNINGKIVLMLRTIRETIIKLNDVQTEKASYKKIKIHCSKSRQGCKILPIYYVDKIIYNTNKIQFDVKLDWSKIEIYTIYPNYNYTFKMSSEHESVKYTAFIPYETSIPQRCSFSITEEKIKLIRSIIIDTNFTYGQQHILTRLITCIKKLLPSTYKSIKIFYVWVQRYSKVKFFVIGSNTSIYQFYKLFIYHQHIYPCLGYTCVYYNFKKSNKILFINKTKLTSNNTFTSTINSSVSMINSSIPLNLLCTNDQQLSLRRIDYISNLYAKTNFPIFLGMDIDVLKTCFFTALGYKARYIMINKTRNANIVNIIFSSSGIATYFLNNKPDCISEIISICFSKTKLDLFPQTYISSLVQNSHFWMYSIAIIIILGLITWYGRYRINLNAQRRQYNGRIIGDIPLYSYNNLVAKGWIPPTNNDIYGNNPSRKINKYNLSNKINHS